jgi:hypothetical protein
MVAIISGADLLPPINVGALAATTWQSALSSARIDAAKLWRPARDTRSCDRLAQGRDKRHVGGAFRVGEIGARFVARPLSTKYVELV